MVEQVGSRSQAVVGATAASVPVHRVPSRRDETIATQRELSAIAFGFDKTVPVDTTHVEEVRRAIRNGTYPVLPETIADRLLALKLDWTPQKRQVQK